jgi:hypothetical protein
MILATFVLVLITSAKCRRKQTASLALYFVTNKIVTY